MVFERDPNRGQLVMPKPMVRTVRETWPSKRVFTNATPLEKRHDDLLGTVIGLSNYALL